jgi:hypothetical protein
MKHIKLFENFELFDTIIDLLSDLRDEGLSAIAISGTKESIGPNTPIEIYMNRPCEYGSECTDPDGISWSEIYDDIKRLQNYISDTHKLQRFEFQIFSKKGYPVNCRFRKIEPISNSLRFKKRMEGGGISSWKESHININDRIMMNLFIKFDPISQPQAS